MSDNVLAEIIQLCLILDKKAAQVYLHFSNQAKEAPLRSFWRELSEQESQHMVYWEKLLQLSQEGEITNIFDEPNLIKEELEILNTKTDSMIKEIKGIISIPSSFLICLRLEFYLLHPAFEALFHLMASQTGDPSPEEDYENHINEIIQACEEFCTGRSPEIELIKELISRIWQNNRNLSHQLANIRTLRGLIPICISCKKIRDDQGYWDQVESYIHKHTDASFTHSICPECFKKFHPKHYKKLHEEGKLQ
jgi:rubrerythrin